jgi:hypothetical protein
MMLNKIHFLVLLRDAAGSTTNTTLFFTSSKHFADVLNGKLEDQQLELTQEDLDMDYRRWKNSRYGSRAKPVPGQNNSTNPTSKFGAYHRLRRS